MRSFLTPRPDRQVLSKHPFAACASGPAPGGSGLRHQAGARPEAPPRPLPRPAHFLAPPPLTLAVAVRPAQDGTLLDVPESLEEAAHVVLRLLLVEHAHEEFSIFWNKIRRCLPGPGAGRRGGRPRGGGRGNRARPEEKNMGEREKLRRSQGRGSELEREVGRQERAGRGWA